MEKIEITLNWKEVFEKDFNLVLNALKDEYKRAKSEARDKNFLLGKYIDLTSKHSTEVQNATDHPYNGQIFTIKRAVEEMLLLNKKFDFNGAYESFLENYPEKDKEIIIHRIAKIDAYIHFHRLLIKEQRNKIERRSVKPKYKPEKNIGGYDKDELSIKIDELLEGMKRNDAGFEVIFNELEELKESISKLDKKNWKQLLKGKLVDLMTDKSVALGLVVANNIFTDLTGEHFEKFLK